MEMTYELLFVSIAIVTGSILLTRAVFSIPKFLSYQKAQTKLLAHIALEKGIDRDRVEGILNEVDTSLTEEIMK